MIILGLNSDDIGTQLEHLTRRLLEHHGYQNIELNAVGPGGQELDITAEYPMPNVGGGVAAPEKLIGECKAHQARMALPEWLKFIGKLHVATVTTHQPRRGLFVALNGVNPNVRESFRQLHDNGDRLTLLEGDQLLDEALQVFGGVNRTGAVAALARMTARQFEKLDIAYYNTRLYWVFMFGDGAIAVLKSDGAFLTPEESQALTPSLNNRLESAPLVDLAAEKEAQQRFVSAQRLALAILFTDGGAQSEAALRDSLHEFSEAEVTAVLQSLLARGWTAVNHEGVVRLTADADNCGFPSFTDLLRFFLTGGIIPAHYEMLATSNLFFKVIDERAIEVLGGIQGDLPIPEEDWQDIIWLLRHSPSALAYSLHADPMIYNPRIKQAVKDEKADVEDARRFFRSLLKCFEHDFRQPSWAAFYYKRHQLVELEVKQVTKIKSKGGPVLERETTSRIGIGQWTEEHGGGLLFIEVLTHAPEPWEWMNKP